METIYQQTEKTNFGGDRLRRIPIGVAGYPWTQNQQKNNVLHYIKTYSK